jgi:hypothetical protein
MILDIFLLMAVAVLTALLGALGFHMANNPESIPKHKGTYLSIFIVLCLLLLGATFCQAIHTAREQTKARNDALAEQKRLEDQIGKLQGKSDTVLQFVSHPQPGLDSSQVAVAVRAMLGQPLREWPFGSGDAHSVALTKFFSTSFPEMLGPELDGVDRFYLYYLMKHGGLMMANPEEAAKLRDLYVREFKVSPEVATDLLVRSFRKLQRLNFLQHYDSTQEPTLEEPAYSRLRKLLARGGKVP